MRFAPVLVACLLSLPALVAQDAEGCKDHSLFNRMPRFHITECVQKEFDGFKFPTGKDVGDETHMQAVEGKLFDISYEKDEGSPEVSLLAIARNFENALKKIGATLVAKTVEPGNNYSFITAKIAKPGSEIWVLLTGSDGEYRLNIVEKQAMEQVIQANDMYAALQKDGFIALDIHFDTGKATIKADSQDLVAQIAELLKGNPSLKVSLEGHTDNKGTPAGNKKLSEDRAKAVVAAVAAKGIASARMVAVGWGQEKPVADNRTEEGRAKNRRVEVVKK